MDKKTLEDKPRTNTPQIFFGDNASFLVYQRYTAPSTTAHRPLTGLWHRKSNQFYLLENESHWCLASMKQVAVSITILKEDWYGFSCRVINNEELHVFPESLIYGSIPLEDRTGFEDFIRTLFGSWQKNIIFQEPSLISSPALAIK
jgi:hypothetical protein